MCACTNRQLVSSDMFSGPTKAKDPVTGKYFAPTEAGRRQQYIDKMTDGADTKTTGGEVFG